MSIKKFLKNFKLDLMQRINNKNTESNSNIISLQKLDLLTKAEVLSQINKIYNNLEPRFYVGGANHSINLT